VLQPVSLFKDHLLYISVNKTVANTQSVCFFGGKSISVVCFDTDTGR